MTHPAWHGSFHSLASLGYVPFALTSALIASSTPFVTISPVGILLLAFVPPLTLFPLLCLFYRRLERFDTVSLTVQRARIYIMVAGSGLCILVAAHLIMVHIVSNSHNTTYNRMVIPYTPSQVELQVRVASWTASSTSTSASSTVDPQVSTRSIGSKGSIHVELSRTTSTMKDDPPNKVQSDRLDQSIAITTKQIESGTDVATDHLLSPVSVLSDSQLKQVDIGALESSATTITATTTFPTETTNNPDTLPPPLPPLVHLESRSFATPGYNLAGVHLLLFLVAEASLLVLLTTLFLGVLIMTEYVLDREDENEAKARWYFWGRIVGVVMATVVGAVHGSFLSACVLLDGQSDCIAKAVVGTIFLYWVGMIAIMNRTTGPLPY